jgi:hypothetical protein
MFLEKLADLKERQLKLKTHEEVVNLHLEFYDFMISNPEIMECEECHKFYTKWILENIKICSKINKEEK